MTPRAVSERLGIAMCEALGLNPSDVLAIDVQYRPHEPVMAIVTMHPTEGALHELTKLRYTAVTS